MCLDCRVLAACLALALCGPGAHASTVHGFAVEPPRSLEAVQLVDHRGRATTLPLRADRWQLVAFGYTRCPDVCPMTLHKLALVLGQLGPRAERIEGVFVSIDGRRDGGARMKAFVARFHPRLLGLTGDPEVLAAAAGAFGVLTRRFRGKTALAYTLSHSSLLYLVDPRGRLRLVYSERVAPEQIVRDLERLLG